MSKFNIGDVVRLNSDKVRMTVSKVGELVTARWHDTEDDLLTGEFDALELTLVSAASTTR